MAQTLAKQLDALMDAHKLTSLSVSRATVPHGHRFFTSFAHDGKLCAHGHADKPERAMAIAIEKLNEMRVTIVTVPALQAA